MSRTALDCCIYIRKEVMVWQQGDGKRAPQTEEYVEGNTVRKVERVPRYEEQERGHQQKRNVSHTVTVREIRKKALQMNLFPYCC